MKYRYIGDCATGFVSFTSGMDTVFMPAGEAVDVPDWLARKLANNDHFEAVTDDGVTIMPKRRGRPPKVRDDAG